MNIHTIDSTGPLDVRGTIDLRTIAAMLAAEVDRLPPAYVFGKTVLRNVVMDHLDCSAARAEAIVDRLEKHGYVQFSQRALGSLRWRPRWHISAEPRT